ncbi:histidine kinase, partial [Streptomyces oryzae]|nr:histidine kinase [Streptomyces oryzae]
GSQGGSSGTGEYAYPGSPSEGPGSTSEIPRITPDGPADTGEYAQSGSPDGPGHTGQFARPQAGGGPGDTTQFARPSFEGPAPARASDGESRPSWARPEQSPGDEDTPRGHDEPEGTGEYAAPGYPGGGQDSRHQQGMDPAEGIPSVPPAPADAPTPIFASMESNWFRGPGRPEPGRPTPHAPSQQGQDQPEQTPGAGPESIGAGTGAEGPGRQPSQAATPRPGQPASAVPPLPQRQGAQGSAGETGQSGAAPDAGWGASPNDERWRQAEQLRQPAAGGVTTSGLPRRVPRANLVAGTAQQQSSAQSGPQVSRAPDDVRGRLTNLRRGIQQGRQAGTDNRGAGPTYQQER